MNFKTLSLALASIAALSACTGSDVRQDYLPATFSPYVNQARQLPPSGTTAEAVMKQPANGTGFNAWLSRDYKALMLFEYEQMQDYISADMYASRSLAAAKGQSVAPLPLEAFHLPSEPLPSMKQGRADMLDLFGKGAREKFPQEAAFAQSRFDCWVEQQEENHQPNHIAQCRDEFVAALKDLRAKMTPPPPPPAPKAMPKPMFQDSYIVYFNFDSVDLGEQARGTVTEVVKALQAQNAGASIIGYTDTSGSAAYNKTLSERRSKAVSDMLLQAGIRPAVVTTEGRGETDLAKPTADGKKEPANRRAVINIR